MNGFIDPEKEPVVQTLGNSRPGLWQLPKGPTPIHATLTIAYGMPLARAFLSRRVCGRPRQPPRQASHPLLGGRYTYKLANRMYGGLHRSCQGQQHRQRPVCVLYSWNTRTGPSRPLGMAWTGDGSSLVTCGQTHEGSPPLVFWVKEASTGSFANKRCGSCRHLSVVSRLRAHSRLNDYFTTQHFSWEEP